MTAFNLTAQRACTLAASLSLGATATLAEVTAQHVWDNWTNQVAIYGQGFTTGGETMSGDTLTVSDVRIMMSDDEAAITANLGDIMLTENGDGTVAVTMSESYPITINLTPRFDDPTTIMATVAQTGMSLIVSGDPDAMVYDVSADRYALSVDSLGGAAAEEVNLDVAMLAMIDLAGQYRVGEDTLTQMSYAMTIGAIDLDLGVREAGGTGAVSGTADLSTLSMFANIETPLDMDMNADMPPFDDGLAFEGGYSFGDLAYAFDFQDEVETASGALTASGGTLAVSMDYDGVSYTSTTRDLDLSILIPAEFPFPIEATLANYGFDLLIPLSVAENGTRDARLAFNLTDLDISSSLWDLVDPGEVLPRDAITVALGLDADVTPFFDVLDPDQADAMMMADVPGEINAAEITELTIKGAGAEITGDGAFTFDNSDLDTFDGFPRPEGQVTVNLNGINTLIDNLIAMGLIPQEDVMMPRMMLGMFSTPVGDDMLTSTLEVNSEGHVLANGQRLR